MGALYRDVEQWFSERPKWLQEAAVRLISKDELSDLDFNELIELCKAQVGIVSSSLMYRTIPVGSMGKRDEIRNIRINSISQVKGIGALEPRNALQFGSGNLTIVFGQNGSGKSSYVRILKQSCGARKAGKLLRNVFKSSESEQSCILNITDENENKEINWSPIDGVVNEMSSVELYDSDCANIYVNEENEVAYEPWLLSLFTKLTDVCSKVGQSLDLETSVILSKIPQISESSKETELGKWYSSLSRNTKKTEIENNCSWSQGLENELSQLRQRQGETNPTDKAKTLRKTSVNILNLITKILDLEKRLNDDSCSDFIKAKSESKIKRRVADEDSKKVFEGATLEGIASESWVFLWEQARNYSTNHAYPNNPFPNVEEDASCVLCQQPLNDEAKVRLENFEAFVKGELQNSAENAEKVVEDLINGLGEIPTIEDINLLMDSAGIHNQDDRIKVLNCYEYFERRKSMLLSIEPDKTMEKLKQSEIPSLFAIIDETIKQQATTYELDAIGDNCKVIVDRINELETKKWISQQKKAIEDEVSRKKALQKYKEAQDLVKTQALSIKKSSLTEELVTKEYIKRFENELLELGGKRIKVEIIKTKAQRGHVYHQLKLKDNQFPNINSADVLSEGEFRVVSLACFLADVEGRPNNSPFIFDDPISSLDQDFEEATVKRLFKLCSTRQVIVFTHRLSLLTLLKDAAEKEKMGYEVVSLRAERWGAGEPGNIPIYGKKTKEALNTLLNDRLARALKVLNVEGFDEYEYLAKGICSDFRILIERIVENDLIADVIQRFRRSVETKNKILKLAQIKNEDCHLLDEFMTKYSIYEHSQSTEISIKLPEPEELQEDMETLRDWLIDFQKRMKDVS